METLPQNWSELQSDTIYQTSNGMKVSFASEQIQQGIRYDSNNKHLKAINKGIVPAGGNIGLVASEVDGYDWKSKVLGKGDDRRFHGKMIDDVLHFPGFDTEH
ncbi:hypothetical protein B9T16_10365 [Arthrospira sp. PCC 8006]|uniref:hypothetical protein n=1 Tax=Oscillatoriales TaxID=1150 RepID=UPI00396E9965